MLDCRRTRALECVSVVIPAMNEERNLPWVLRRMPGMVDEIVLVDGNSTDRTIEVARRIRPDVRVVTQPGTGKGDALRAGFEAARGDFIVMIDADGSMDPAEIPACLAELHDRRADDTDTGRYELVKGSRFLDGGGTADMSPVRRAGNTALLRLVNALYSADFTDLCYGLIAFRRDQLNHLELEADGFEIETEIVVRGLKAGVRIGEVASFEKPRMHGQSNLRTWRDGTRVLVTLLRERFKGALAGGTMLLLVGLLALLAAGASAARADVGFPSGSFSGASAPTGQKPQSKLWFHDGSWWASMFDPATTDHEIYRLDNGEWHSTGTLIDGRVAARVDALDAGDHLYIASAGSNPATASHVARVMRYSYDSAARTYRLDSGFPVTIPTGGGMEAVVLDRDSTGRLWITYTRDSAVYVAHSTTADTAWTAPYVLPVAQASGLTPDDISTVVAYTGRIGVMWSNQSDQTMYFAYHANGDPDDVWTTTVAASGPEIADDHMNVKALANDPAGQVFAATKTSLNGASDPLILLNVLGNDGVWRRYTVARVADSVTRPLLLIDQTNRRLYVFLSSPCCSGGAIYYKETSLDDIAFPTGKGTAFMSSDTDTHINNPSSTKQTLSPSTGLVAIAGDDTAKRYWWNQLALPAPPRTVFADGFETADFSRWTTVTAANGGTAQIETDRVAAGTYAARLAETSQKGSIAYLRKKLASPETDLRVLGRFAIEAEGPKGANVPIFRLFDGSGTRLLTLYRPNQSNKLWVSYGGANYATTGALALGTWGSVEIRATVAGANSTVTVFLNGTQIYSSSSADLGTGGIAALQVGNNTAAQPFTLVADAITATAP